MADGREKRCVGRVETAAGVQSVEDVLEVAVV
jgi:hypothetical protein